MTSFLMLWALLTGTAAAADPSMPICADIVLRAQARNANADEVAAYIRKDDRTYAPDVNECLCVFNVQPAILRETRRHTLRDGLEEGRSDLKIAINDPLTSATFQVSTLVGKRLEDLSGRQQPFIILPTLLKPPEWLDVGPLVTNLRDFEVPGVRLQDKTWWNDQGVFDLPEGPLAQLLVDKVPDEFRLTALRGTFDRILWFQLSEEEDGSTRLAWSLRDITGRPPYPELAQDTLRLLPSQGAMVDSCGSPSSTVRRRWRTRMQWPPSRVATATTGAVLAAVFGSLALNEYLRFNNDNVAIVGDAERNQAMINRNLAFGSVALAGGVIGVTGLAIPGKVWRRR